MTTYHPTDASIHVLARALIIQGDSVLLCIYKDNYFFPGGHVENGESILTALEREFVEELGGFPHTQPVAIGVCENQFSAKDDVIQHEINHIFVTEVDPSIELMSKEGFISFEKIKIADLAERNIVPTQLKNALITWFTDKKPFFIGM